MLIRVEHWLRIPGCCSASEQVLVEPSAFRMHQLFALHSRACGSIANCRLYLFSTPRSERGDELPALRFRVGQFRHMMSRHSIFVRFAPQSANIWRNFKRLFSANKDGENRDSPGEPQEPASVCRMKMHSRRVVGTHGLLRGSYFWIWGKSFPSSW